MPGAILAPVSRRVDTLPALAMRSILDVGNLSVLLGLVTLGISCCVPSWSAARVARVENRALEVAEEVLALVRRDGIDPLHDPARRDAWLATLRAGCEHRDQPLGDLPDFERGAPEANPTLGNRHYLFRVLARPTANDSAAPNDGAQVLEVFAWPRNLLPPGRSVFCLGEDGHRAFTRNLIASFAGLDAPPPPGAALPRTDEVDPETGSYRSADDERWLLLDP